MWCSRRHIVVINTKTAPTCYIYLWDLSFADEFPAAVYMLGASMAELLLHDNKSWKIFLTLAPKMITFLLIFNSTELDAFTN